MIFLQDETLRWIDWLSEYGYHLWPVRTPGDWAPRRRA